jgi:hypothetical protein
MKSVSIRVLALSYRHYEFIFFKYFLVILRAFYCCKLIYHLTILRIKRRIIITNVSGAKMFCL